MPRKPKITVINTDRTFLTLMDSVLADAGFDVKLLHETPTAYKIIRDWRPDLVILDVRLEHPGEGFMVLDLLKLDPNTAEIPIVVCSADYDQMDTMRDRLSASGVQILLKPFQVQELLTIVYTTLAATDDPAASQ